AFFAIEAVLGTARGAWVLAAPFEVLWGGLVLFTAVRLSRWIPLVAGAAAALESLLLYWMLRPEVAVGLPFSFAGASMRAGALLLCGVAGSVLARQLALKSEQALVDVRERDLMGRYLLGERIGVGGMAEVFAATHCPEGGFL